MDRQSFLLKLLAGIIAFQAFVFSVALIFCSRNGGLKNCPELGDRYEQTFNIMITTTLALLTGNSVKR